MAFVQSIAFIVSASSPGYRQSMLTYRPIMIVFLLLAVAGCSGKPPYVNRPYTINRELADFPVGPEIKQGTQVTVCYAKSKATPASIRALAEEECGRAGLGAILVEQTLDVCPLLTPIAAIFQCGNAVREKRAGINAQPGSLVPSFAAPSPAGAGRAVGTIGAADVSTTAKSEPFPTYLFNPGPQSQ